MPHTIKPITPETLDKFYEAYPHEKTFLQTSQYAEFRQNLNEKILLRGIFKNDKLIGTALIQKIPAKRSSHLHTPHGPLLLDPTNKTTLKFFIQEYKKLGKEQHCDFVRISPLLPPETKQTFIEQKMCSAPTHLVNPEITLTLDITQTPEEILKQMRKSTRYEIRRIEKTGIKTQMGNTPKDLEIFWNLHQKTVARHGFVPFTKASTQTELQTFKQNCQIFSAKTEEEYLSSSIILFDNHAAYYHQGASTRSKLPAAHATLWHAILEAKKRGCKQFNFWGISPEDQPNHPWHGLSKFKRGFGGEQHTYLHAQDYPITKKYYLNYIVEKYRKWKRNY